jgi:hypothetical protein
VKLQYDGIRVAQGVSGSIMPTEKQGQPYGQTASSARPADRKDVSKAAVHVLIENSSPKEIELLKATKVGVAREISALFFSNGRGENPRQCQSRARSPPYAQILDRAGRLESLEAKDVQEKKAPGHIDRRKQAKRNGFWRPQAELMHLGSQTGIGGTEEPIQIRSRPIRAYGPQGEKPSDSPYRDKGPLNVWDTPDGGGDETPVKDRVDRDYSLPDTSF